MKNILEMVIDYFKANDLRYEPICVRPCSSNEKDNYLYCVLARYIGDADFKKNTYAVWTCFNTNTNSMNYGHYDMSYGDAYRLFIEYGKQNEIFYERLSELATYFKDGLEANDKEEALKYFVENCGMTDEELDYFGIEPPKKYKTVQVDFDCNFNVIMPQDQDEHNFDYNEYLMDYIEENIKSSDFSIGYVKDDIPEKELDKFEDYYGYKECLKRGD